MRARVDVFVTNPVITIFSYRLAATAMTCEWFFIYLTLYMIVYYRSRSTNIIEYIIKCVQFECNGNGRGIQCIPLYKYYKISWANEKYIH